MFWAQLHVDERELFLSHGWQDVGFLHLDFGEWRGEYRSYGVYRYQAVVRRPERLVSTAISEENYYV